MTEVFFGKLKNRGGEEEIWKYLNTNENRNYVC
jgi:hypothetical protein